MKSARLLILLSLCLCLVLGKIWADDDQAPKKKKEDRKAKEELLIAHIKVGGSLPDASFSGENLFSGLGDEPLRTVVQRIKKAKTDANVQALYVEMGGLGTSWGKMHELQSALADFRASGKKVYAYLENGSQNDYVLACSCDTILIPPLGSIELVGLRQEMMFFKDLLAKFHLRFDAIPIGEFKSAMEQFTNNKMSPANRKQWEELMDDFYAILCESIAKGRGMSPQQVKELIDEGPFTAKQALEKRLVDALVHPSELESYMRKQIGKDELVLKKDYAKEKGQEVDLSNPFAIFKLLAPPKEAKMSAKPKIAVIYAEGAIVTGKGGPSFMGGNEVGSTTFVEAIRKANAEPTIKAIVLRVDSPGGSALASDLIWQALSTCQKPVVASMGDVAASGGYYISMAAQRIFAEPGTITGSIGVIGGKLVLEDALQTYGVTTEVINRGKRTGLMSLTQGFSPEDRNAVVKMMTDIYDSFLDKAWAGRQKAGNTKIKSREELKTLAGGRVWSGRAALANGLVDELGTLDDAVAYAKKLAKVEGDDVEIYLLPKKQSLFEKLMEPGAELSLRQMGVNHLVTTVPQVRQLLGMLDLMLRHPQERVWLLLPPGYKIK
jgi:protease-4